MSIIRNPAEISSSLETMRRRCMTFTGRRSAARVLVLAATLVVAALWSTAISNAQTDPTNAVRVTRQVSGDLVTAGRSVRVEGEVAGDAAVAGNNVTLDGPVRGYILSAGRTLTIDGPIGNDLWAAGERIDVTSRIDNNAMIAGRAIHLRPQAFVGHDAHLAGSTVVTE